MRIKILDQTVFWSVLQGMVGVIVVICAIDFLFGLLDLMGKITAEFSFWDALITIILQLPARFIEFASVASLIGALVALGIKASSAELVVMRAAGWSKTRILIPALVAALVMSSLSLLLAQFVVPSSAQITASLGSEHRDPVWLRDGQTFAKIDRVTASGQLLGITLIDIKEKALESVRRVESATYNGEEGLWLLKNVVGTDIGTDAVHATQSAQQQWSPQATPEEFIAIARQPESLAITQLVRFIQYREEQSLDVRRYRLTLWKTLLQPLANLVMVFLASSLVFGSMRMVSMGYRLTIGLLFGLGFYYAQDLFGFLSLVYGFHPLVTLLLPLFGFATLAWSRFR